MRRAIPAAGLSAAALILLSRFHTTPEASGARLRPSVPTATQPPVSSPAPDTAGPTGGEGAPTAPATTAPASSAAAHDGTFTGSEVETRWGPVQVRIVVQGGKLTDVQAVEVPDSHERSIEINDQATPILRDEALTAQSANLDLVSGATITWDGYRQSLQAALDQAHG